MLSAIIQKALFTLDVEIEALQGLKSHINPSFEEVVRTIFNSNGRLIITGIGKSAIVAQKIVATLNSTGTPSLFMHAADAIHGDLGMIQPQDLVMIISKSGESPEIKVLAPLIKNFGNALIAMVGNTQSFLAQQANYLLNCSVSQEACPNNLAPTSSTTAQMALGDALAVALMELNQFSGKDFAKYHPGGNLGKQLYLKVDDLILNKQQPSVFPHQTIFDAILEITQKRLGAAAVINHQNEVLGIITDGDLRRMLEKNKSIEHLVVSDVYTQNPKCVESGLLAVEAMQMMKENDISQLIITNQNKYVGIVHLHELLKEGIL